MKILSLFLARETEQKVGYLMSFAENDGGLIAALQEKYQADFTLYYTPNIAETAEQYQAKGIRTQVYSRKYLLMGGIRELSELKVLVVDNYYAETSLLTKTEIIQIWHATGAIKYFGWLDPKTSSRPKMERTRFQKVYDQMNQLAVGSQAMAEIFQESYNLPSERVQVIGAPRTDDFQPEVTQPEEITVEKLLYVPTYRDDVEMMKQILDQALAAFEKLPELVVTLKLHPSLSELDLTTLPKNVKIAKDNLPNLLAQADLLVSDYSSTVFDFMLKKPQNPYLFFCPDLTDYQKNTGLQPFFTTDFIGKISGNVEQFVAQIEAVKHFKANERHDLIRQKWHQQNDGAAVARVLNLINKTMEDA